MFGSLISLLALALVAEEHLVLAEDSTALKFGDDGDSWIALNPGMSALTDKFSFCVWMKQGSASSPVVFAYEQGELYIYDYGGYVLLGTSGTPSTRIPDLQWTQFCGSWSLTSQMFKAYYNGTHVHTSTTPYGRKLPTGGELVLGNYFKGASGNQFGGEMYNLNFFSKELTDSEVAAMSADGLCTKIPEELEAYREIKWEDMLKLDRSGTVQDVNLEECEVPSGPSCEEELSVIKAQLEEAEQKNRVQAGELNKTKTDLENAYTRLNETNATLKETKEELDDKNTELEDTKKELKRYSERSCLEKGNLTHWDVFYSSAYHNKIFTQDLFEHLKTSWDSLSKTLVDIKMTDDVIELLKKLENICDIK